MRYARMALLVLVALCFGGTAWTYAGGETPVWRQGSVSLVSYGEAGGEALPANMSAWVKTAQARCPAGQLVFLTNACGCNGACCACSAQVPYLDHCSCRCSATPPTTCNRGFSAGRR